MDCSTPGFPLFHYLPEFCSNSCPLSRWCHSTISSSVSPFSSCLLSFLAPGSSPVSQFFSSDGQRIGASASVLPMNMQGRFPLGLTDLISLLSKRLSRVFSNIKLQKHQFCSALILFYDPTLTSVRDYWKNHNFDYMDLCQQSDISLLSMLARFIIAFLLRSKHLLIL